MFELQFSFKCDDTYLDDVVCSSLKDLDEVLSEHFYEYGLYIEDFMPKNNLIVCGVIGDEEAPPVYISYIISLV